jgi:nitrous oxidase accessory protein NosD
VVLLELSSGITFRDLAIDGNRTQVSYGDEQSHGVEVRGSSSLRFERVLFTGMHGDGVRLLALMNPEPAWVTQVWIEDCMFSHNARSGIAVQRGVRDVTITGNDFTQLSDQAIDMEPSNADIDDIGPRNFEIRNNRFYETAPLSLTITGVSKAKPAEHVIVVDNDFEGTGIFVFNAVDVRIESNRIRSGQMWAPIAVRKMSERVSILNNLIDARATPEGAGIVLAFHNSAAPRDVQVIDNTILTSGGSGFLSRDAEGLLIKGNTFTGSGEFGIIIQDIVPGSPLARFVIEDNTIQGFKVGVSFVSRGDETSDVCIRANHFANVGTVYSEQGPIRSGCDSL